MKSLREIKILIADGHDVVASGIAKVLDDITEFQVVGQAKNGEDALQLCEHRSPDVVSIDIDLPGPISGLEVIRRLQRKSPHTHILILTNLLDNAIITEALRGGVVSYLLKNSSIDELVHAVRAAHHGISTLSPEVTQVLVQEMSTPIGYHLTAREMDVLEHLSQGLNNNEIAEKLSVSLSTVQFHVSNILNKLGVHNRIEAATFAVRHKLAS